jgi:sucrose-6-phosphatase
MTNIFEPFLLAADLDGTLLGDETGEEMLRNFRRSNSENFLLAFVTGCSLPSIRKLIEGNRLPQPDYICSDVGTELLDCSDPGNRLGQKYTTQVSASWNLETLYALGEGEGVWRQDFPEGQPRFQAGFYWDGKPETLATFYNRLADQEDCYILPSFGEYIDILPTPLGKGNVVQFLQKELGLNPARIVVAGDAGNDREMFEIGLKGIVPANALEELKNSTKHPWIFHSSLPAGRGVMDGLRYFGFIE